MNNENIEVRRACINKISSTEVDSYDDELMIRSITSELVKQSYCQSQIIRACYTTHRQIYLSLYNYLTIFMK